MSRLLSARAVFSALIPAAAAAAALALGAWPTAPAAAGDTPRYTAATPAVPGDDIARLLAEGDGLRRRGAYRSARRLLEQAHGLARSSGDRAAEIDTLAALARDDDALGDAGAAAAEREAALAIARDAGDGWRAAGILSDAGLAHARRAEGAPARDALRRALILLEEAGDRSGAAETRTRLGYLAMKEGRYDEAFADYDAALAIETAAGDLTAASDTRLLRGLAHLDRRAFKRALEDFRAAAALGKRAGDLQRQVEGIDHVGIAHLFMNAPNEARAFFEQSLALARAHQDRALEMRAMHLLGNALREAGLLHEAIAAYDQAAAWCESEGDLRETAWIRFRRGKAEESLGRLEDAGRSWSASLELWQSVGEHRAAAWAAYDLARLLERTGRTDKAIDAYRKAADAQHAVALPYASMPLGDLALLLARFGRAAPAREAAAEAVAHAEKVDNPEMRWRALYRRGQVERLLSRPADALASLRQSLDVIESMRPEVGPGDEARAGFMVGRQEVYSAAVDVLMEMGRPGEALEVSERARARAFLDLLGGAPENNASSAATGPVRDRIDAPAVAPEEGADAAGPRRGATPDGSRHGVPPGGGGPRGRPAPGSPAPDALPVATLSVPPLSLEGIRAEARGRRATILEYFTADERSYVFSVAPDGEVRGATIPLGAPRLAEAINRLRRALDVGEPSPVGLFDLRAALIGPIADALPRDPSALVVVVPHGPLTLLPFAALVEPDGDYVVQHHTLVYAPAAGVLNLASRHPGQRAAAVPSVLAVGNPLPAGPAESVTVLPALPAAEAEARAVASAFKTGNPVLLVGAQATEARVRALAPGRSILHFATHALTDEADPLASRLLLAPGCGARDDDGSLDAREIATLRLHADLVTLSACGSGLGGTTGEAIGGLARAFMAAGARSLVVSLWRVADVAAREEMTRFYTVYGRDGLGPARALRQAQVQMIEALRRGTVRSTDGRPLPASPAFWAPYVVIGEPGL